MTYVLNPYNTGIGLPLCMRTYAMTIRGVPLGGTGSTYMNDKADLSAS